MLHLNEGTRWMPRYVYGMFCERVGRGLFLKWLCCVCVYAFKVLGFKFDLFGHPIIAHLERLRFRCAHYENFPNHNNTYCHDVDFCQRVRCRIVILHLHKEKYE